MTINTLLSGPSIRHMARLRMSTCLACGEQSVHRYQMEFLDLVKEPLWICQSCLIDDYHVAWLAYQQEPVQLTLDQDAVDELNCELRSSFHE